MTLAFDHIAISAPNLTDGVRHVRSALGVDVPEGGRHPNMATHNRLMRLGRDEFLEIIAPDPEAAPPQRPRWFGLDTPPATPRLATWVLRTDDLAAVQAQLGSEVGEPCVVSRGALEWTILLPPDGSLPSDGIMPAIIQWPDRLRPGSTMPDFGCALTSLVLAHPDAARLGGILRPHLDDPRIRFEISAKPGLRAEIETPDGLRSLS